MNEQLVVKNFGPIKDATVDFKRVTVFIGPTGGGKSTLAKLAAIVKQGKLLDSNFSEAEDLLHEFGLRDYLQGDTTSIRWRDKEKIGFDIHTHEISDNNKSITLNQLIEDEYEANQLKYIKEIDAELIELIDKNPRYKALESLVPKFKEQQEALIRNYIRDSFKSILFPFRPEYIPAERIFLAAIGESWAGIIRDDIGLPKLFVEFANKFATARRDVTELVIPFLSITFNHREGQDYIKPLKSGTQFRLAETASGIQSVTPLLVLLEHLSRNTEQAQSFIIEEPELNLFPTAQFELVKILVEKCAQLEGQNDLVLTTHSPYVLTALNLLCYAFRIAQQGEATAKKVAKLIPRNCWIDPDQFAAYYVDRPDTKRKQQVRSIINKKTGLIEENELDTASEALGDIFDKLVRLHKPTSATARAK